MCLCYLYDTHNSLIHTSTTYNIQHRMKSMKKQQKILKLKSYWKNVKDMRNNPPPTYKSVQQYVWGWIKTTNTTQQLYKFAGQRELRGKEKWMGKWGNIFSDTGKSWRNWKIQHHCCFHFPHTIVYTIFFYSKTQNQKYKKTRIIQFSKKQNRNKSPK